MLNFLLYCLSFEIKNTSTTTSEKANYSATNYIAVETAICVVYVMCLRVPYRGIFAWIFWQVSMFGMLLCITVEQQNVSNFNN